MQRQEDQSDADMGEKHRSWNSNTLGGFSLRYPQKEGPTNKLLLSPLSKSGLCLELLTGEELSVSGLGLAPTPCSAILHSALSFLFSLCTRFDYTA